MNDQTNTLNLLTIARAQRDEARREREVLRQERDEARESLYLNTRTEQPNTAKVIIDMLTHNNPEETITITISNTHHTITIYPNGTWTQINHK